MNNYRVIRLTGSFLVGSLIFHVLDGSITLGVSADAQHDQRDDCED